ncbi:MAG: transglutaminase-like domain-containing protein [Atopobiaceae bacterium]|nr:transglutaminase-like domain-containing protein [Atopobiaceae bacterium]MCI2172707.1 transglutaminase-like domain-containing protein [Atopobiaceae bacterium]MCI2207014.1 transglutaminase-like domain-containing protein [Atopobiaceae bacterium]
MQDVRCGNQDFAHLNDGLPPEIARLKAAGRLDRAITLADQILADGSQPALAPVLRAERLRMGRLASEFTLSRKQAIALLREEVPDLKGPTFDRLVRDRRIDWRYVGGKPRYMPGFIDSLRLYPDECPGLEPPAARDTRTRDDMIRSMERRGSASCRVTLRASISAEGVAGRFVRAWLPFPQEGPRQTEVRVLDATPGVRLAPPDAPQRTAFWKTSDSSSFEITYSYVSTAGIRHLGRPDPGQPDFDLDEVQPHIVFTPYLRQLAHEIITDTYTPVERARAIYDYVTGHVDYRFQPPYMHLDAIADTTAKSLRGDCGCMAVLFITLCRIAGIPARWESGLYVSPDHVGPHDWAMFYVAPMGWLWADCSFGSHARADGNEWLRDHYFGSLDPWRMVSNSEFFSPLTPVDTAVRDDPYDNQLGEMSVDGHGLDRHEMRRAVRLVSMEQL